MTVSRRLPWNGMCDRNIPSWVSLAVDVRDLNSTGCGVLSRLELCRAVRVVLRSVRLGCDLCPILSPLVAWVYSGGRRGGVDGHGTRRSAFLVGSPAWEIRA